MMKKISKEEELSGLESIFIQAIPVGYEGNWFSIKSKDLIVEVMQKAISILKILSSSKECDWAVDLLPKWFVESFSPPLSEAEKEAYMSKPYEEKVNDDRWDLLGWLYWREKENLCWHWWGFNEVSENEAAVCLICDDDLFSTSDFTFLMESSGASEVSRL